jgi:hypothetical protein
MASFIEVIIQQSLGWYLGLINLTDPFAAVVFICLNFLLVKVTLTLFPFLKPFINIITMPFRFIHFYSHVQAAHQIEKEIKEEGRRKELKNSETSHLIDEEDRLIEFGVYNRFEFEDHTEGSNLYFSCKSLDDTIRVAMAPWKHALAFFIVYLVILPFAKIGGFFGLVIHLYSSIVLFYALIPSSSDYQMVLNTMLKEAFIPKFCVYWIYVVFFSVFLEIVLRTKNIIAGLAIALIYSFIYYFFLLAMIKLSFGKNKLKYPVLVKIPSKSANRSSPSPEGRLFPKFSNEIDY